MRTALLLSAALATLAACRGETSQDPPVVPLRNMHQQQRYNPQSHSRFFSDQRTMRVPPAGTVARFPGGANPQYGDFTVARDESFDDDRVTLGLEPDSTAYVATIPASVVGSPDNARELVRRGQQRYEIYCTPCHGLAGDGRGIVWQRGQGGRYTYPQPPTFHDERVRHMPDGQIFATITNGVRNMPSYAPQIPARDRWAIVSYVRALQISQAGGGTP